MGDDAPIFWEMKAKIAELLFLMIQIISLQNVQTHIIIQEDELKEGQSRTVTEKYFHKIEMGGAMTKTKRSDDKHMVLNDK